MKSLTPRLSARSPQEDSGRLRKQHNPPLLNRKRENGAANGAVARKLPEAVFGPDRTRERAATAHGARVPFPSRTRGS